MVNNPIKNGTILGVLLMITSFLMAMISPEKYVLYGSYLLFILALGFMIKIGRDARTLNEGILSFGEAFKAIFIGSAIAFGILIVFEYLLNNFIFPDLATIRYEQTMGIFDWIAETINEISEDDITDEMNEAKESITMEMMEFDIATCLYNYFAWLVLVGTFVGMIVAFFTKKDPSGV